MGLRRMARFGEAGTIDGSPSRAKERRRAKGRRWRDRRRGETGAGGGEPVAVTADHPAGRRPGADNRA
jgi:hypothetical protein